MVAATSVSSPGAAMEPEAKRTRSRLVWWLVPVLAPAAVLGHFAPGYWTRIRDAAERAGEPKPVTSAVIYGCVWLASVILLPLLVAVLRRRRDGFLAVLDETLTMVLLAFAVSGGLALIAAK